MNEVIDHYNRLIDEGNDPVFDSEPLREYMDKWDGQTFIDKMALDNTKSVLEIGVGTGRLARRTAPLCKTFVGIDFSNKTIEQAKKNLPFNNVELICADFLEYIFPDKFDVIYSSLTFMHINNKSFAIKKITSLLKVNGKFVLSIDKNPDEYINMGTRRIKIYPDTPQNTAKNIISAGLKIEEKYETAHSYIFIATKDGL